MTPGVTDRRGISKTNLAVGLVMILIVGAVALVGVGGIALLAASGDSGGSNSGASTVDGGGGASNADGGGASTPTPVTTHDIGDTFTVGSGGQAIEYTVTRSNTRQVVGSGVTSEEADGQFVIVELEMTNVADESTSISSNIFALVDGQDREYETDSDAIIAVDNNIVFEQLDPGVTKSGVLVFDVPEDQSSRELRIDPAGAFSGADSQFVTLE